MLNVISQQQQMHNDWRITSGKHAIESSQIELTIDHISSQKKILEIDNFKFLHSFEVKNNSVFGYLLTNETKIYKKWPLKFKKIPRTSTTLKKGYEVDEDVASKKLWATVSNKFGKIDQLIEQHKLIVTHRQTIAMLMKGITDLPLLITIIFLLFQQG